MKNGLFYVEVLFVMVFISCSDQKLDNKQIYDMQEKCSKRAEEIFQKEHALTNSKKQSYINSTHFNSHYNKKHNKCFMITTVYSIEKGRTFYTALLQDANENKMYGTIIGDNQAVYYCRMLGKPCDESKWKELIKPYMEE